MELLDFKLSGGPYGDDTSTYDVKVNKDGATVTDIINYALSKKEDWGYVCIDSFFSDKRLEYRYGIIISDNISSEDKNKVVKTITASGGWSRMDYII